MLPDVVELDTGGIAGSFSEPDLKVGTTSQPLQSLHECVGAHPTFPFVSQTSLLSLIPFPHLLLWQS